MWEFLRSRAFWLWPPYEASFTRKVIEKDTVDSPQDRLAEIQKEVSNLLSSSTNLDEAEVWAQLVFESESRRKESIEDKAVTFVFALGISVAVVSIVPALLGDKWNIPLPAAGIVISFYLLSIIHFLTAVYYAIQVRRVTASAVPSANDFLRSIQQGDLSPADRVTKYISLARFNESNLLKKSNYLTVAETMFLRALILVAVAAILSIAAKALVEIA